MSLFTAALLLASALVAVGLFAVLRRRSLAGAAIGFEIMIGGAIILALTLLGRTGTASSLALVACLVLIGAGAAAAVLVAALHLAMARAAGSERGLEPW